MLSMGQILSAALLHGLILSVALGAVIVGSLRLNAETWLNDYPPDIRKAFGPMSEKARRQRIPLGILFGVVLVGALALGLVWLFRADGSPGFTDIFVYVFALTTTFNLFDLLILDWLWFVKLQPSFVILPGTEGMEGYKDYGFHFRAFLVGLAGTFATALLTAGVAAGIRWLGGGGAG